MMYTLRGETLELVYHRDPCMYVNDVCMYVCVYVCMYVNDLNYFNTNTSLRLYADDTTEYASDVSPVVLQFAINSDLSVLSRWFRMNFFTD